jgi:hypothetical protein
MDICSSDFKLRKFFFFLIFSFFSFLFFWFLVDNIPLLKIATDAGETTEASKMDKVSILKNIMKDDIAKRPDISGDAIIWWLMENMELDKPMAVEIASSLLDDKLIVPIDSDATQFSEGVMYKYAI